MNFFKKLVIASLALITFYTNAISDNHDIVKNNTNAEEPLPLNDPFVGDSSLTGGAILTNDPKEAQNEMSLYKFKLVGVMKSEKNGGFVSLVNAGGDIITVSLFEELSPGVKLVAINNKEAVFEKNSESLLVINFKNQITERSF